MNDMIDEVFNEIFSLAKSAKDPNLLSALVNVKKALGSGSGNTAVRAVKKAYQVYTRSPLSGNSRVMELLNELLKGAMQIEGHQMTHTASRLLQVHTKLALVARLSRVAKKLK